MKILLFHYDELDELGGVETLLRTMANEFTVRGHPTGVIEMGRQFRPRRELIPGVPIWMISASSFPAPGRPRSWVSFARSVMQFRRVIREFNPDIVHIHFPAGQSLPAVGADFLPHRWRLVVTVHNSDIRISPRDPAVRRWQRRLFERAARVTAVSDSLLGEAQELYPCIGGKGEVVYNGITPDWNDSPGADTGTDQRYILYAGRLHAVKGLYTLLDAWKRIEARHAAGLMLRLVGDGPERDGLIAHAEKIGVSQKVEFLGLKSGKALASLYRNAECVVLPSEREGLAMVLLEAGACGAICVGSRVTGIQEVIEHGVTGFLTPYGDAGALADTIGTILTMAPDAQVAMKRAARERIAGRFTQERMLSGYLGIYDRLVHMTGNQGA